MVHAVTVADECMVLLPDGKPRFVAGLVTEEGHCGKADCGGQIHHTGVRADMQAATLQHGRKFFDGEIRRQDLEAGVVHGMGQLAQPFLLAFPCTARSNNGN